MPAFPPPHLSIYIYYAEVPLWAQGNFSVCTSLRTSLGYYTWTHWPRKLISHSVSERTKVCHECEHPYKRLQMYHHLLMGCTIVCYRNCFAHSWKSQAKTKWRLHSTSLHTDFQSFGICFLSSAIGRLTASSRTTGDQHADCYHFMISVIISRSLLSFVMAA